MADRAAPHLSVVITSYDSPLVLRACLESLIAQPEVAEVVVSDCSPEDPARDLAADFPAVRFLHSASRKRVPELRWQALQHVTGDLVGALEARVVPRPDWARSMASAHARHARSPVAGGPVSIAPTASAFELGLYLCEYGAFAPPVRQGPAEALSGANLCYKRAALEAEPELLEAGAWETFLHQRWRAQGLELAVCDAEVVFHNTMSPSVALRQRFHYGRGYAAERVEREVGRLRWIYAALSPALPLLLSWRAARQAFAKRLASGLPGAAGWLLLLNVSWSAGEAVGYLLGADREPRIF